MSTKYFDEQCQKCCGTSGETALEWLLQAKGPSSALVSVHEYYEVSITAVGSTIAA